MSIRRPDPKQQSARIFLAKALQEHPNLDSAHDYDRLKFKVKQIDIMPAVSDVEFSMDADAILMDVFLRKDVYGAAGEPLDLRELAGDIIDVNTSAALVDMNDLGDEVAFHYAWPIRPGEEKGLERELSGLIAGFESRPVEGCK